VLEQKEPVHLLFVTVSTELADKVVSVLRSAGYGTRPAQTENLDAAREKLETQAVDLAITGLGAEIHEIVSLISSTSRDVPLVAVAEEASPQECATSVEAGASQACAIEPRVLLRQCLQRELNALYTRRELRRMEKSHRESERRCHTLLDSSRDAIAYVHEGMHVYANQAYLEMFRVDDFEDIEVLPLLDLAASKDSAKLKSLLREIVDGGTLPEKLELRARRTDVSEFDARVAFSKATVDGEPCTQIMVSDQAISSELAEELNELRTQDLLTGLANRQHLIEQLTDTALHTGDTEPTAALLYLRVDHMADVTQQVGLGNIDVLIKELAEVLRAGVSEEDLPCRFSDDDFAVLLCKRSPEKAEQSAKDLCRRFEERIIDLNNNSISVTISAGLVVIGEAAGGANELISQAVECLNEAVANNGNQVVRFNPAKDAKALSEEDNQWQVLLRNALKTDGFKLYYQPIASIDGSDSDTYRVYLRMATGDDGEHISPRRFLAAAERSNLIQKLDRWVLARAVRVIQKYAATAEHFTLFVRLTAQNLDDSSLLPWLAGVLKEAKVSGQRLVIELSESDVVTNLKPAALFIKGLRELRSRFALIEFGSGLNSPHLLKHLKPDFVKIDPSYTQDLATNPENEAKLNELSQLVQGTGKPVIAEYIEDATSMAILYKLGINYAQGNFLQPAQEEPSYDFGA